MSPLETLALVFLVSFVVVQPWIGFALPDGPRRFTLLTDDEAREALDRALRWDRLRPGERTAVEVAAGLVGVLALMTGFVLGARWLAAVAGALATVGFAAVVRRRGRATVLAAAAARGTAPSPRTRSAKRVRRRRGFAVLLLVSLVGAPLAYRSAGVGFVSGAFAGGTLVVVCTLALIGLVSTTDRVYGDEEPD